ncbi:hypothetical protein I316_06049 [Kwoniella heveanensis BCC8398]|uniref:N-acetyltransferase ESCO acetyl-transferase domain-containing protein n=1 Tax=Kwoniella heveanensis BCC8398 TaxID=1296120 RepID=A0A1B9GMN7_9TREE|nr:hypothetical protein I316_06049 [Kwoniella heveanensis BCC8398]
MTTRPAVIRTYGKAPPRISSASLFDTPSPPASPPAPHSDLITSLPAWSGCNQSQYRSSSPPSSSRLETPVPSSPPTPRRPLFSAPSSPLFFSADDDDDEEGNNRNNSGPSMLQVKGGSLEAGEGGEARNKVEPMKKKKIPVPAKRAVQSTLRGFFAPLTGSQKRKRPLGPSMTVSASTSAGPRKSLVKVFMGSSSKSGKSSHSQGLTQMHLTHLPLLHTCQDCGMSFMRGGDDEGMHAAHHARVLRGIVWDGLGKGKAKAVAGISGEQGWRVVKEDVSFGLGKGAAKGRVVMIDGSWGGPKLDEILSTVDLVLSSPPLPPAIIERCKIFLLLTSSPPPPPASHRSKSSTTKRQRLDPVLSAVAAKKSSGKERVVSVVVAQGIKWAMRVLASAGEMKPKLECKTVVSSGGLGSVICDPKPLPTPLGIHRLYTMPSYRSHGLSLHLLDAACNHTVYGCAFDPQRGEVAFSQPTESGRGVMHAWGKGTGKVRVFVDDESQL